MRVDAFPEGLRARLKGLPSEQPSDDGAEEFCAVRSGQGRISRSAPGSAPDAHS